MEQVKSEFGQRKKETAYRQMQQIATMYPPRENISIIDTEKVGI